MTKIILLPSSKIFRASSKSTKNTISSLQLITTIGVVAGIQVILGKILAKVHIHRTNLFFFVNDNDMGYQ